MSPAAATRRTFKAATETDSMPDTWSAAQTSPPAGGEKNAASGGSGRSQTTQVARLGA